MSTQPLAGKKIAVLVESLYIPEEIEAYQKRFAELGATVHLMSRLWDQPKQTFINDLDGLLENGRPKKPVQLLEVGIDFQNVNVRDYAAVLMAANYTSVRLRYFQPPAGQPIRPEHAREAPAVRFFAEAMANPKIIKGALCHALWLLTPRPELLKGRRVICHEVVLADIVNAGAIYQPSSTGVVVDKDLVTGHSAGDVEAYIDAIAGQIRRVCAG